MLDWLKRRMGIRAVLLCAALAAAPQVSAQPFPELHNSGKIFTDPSEMTGMEATDPAEIARTWEAAIVGIPAPGGAEVIPLAGAMARLEGSGRRWPVVVYMHGCSGIWEGTLRRIRFYADAGFLVIAPASFARLKYPKSCDVAANRGGLYRGTLIMRQQDAGFAIEQVRALPFADPDRIVLAGLSQGGIVAATFRADRPARRTAARIVEGWTCNAGWPEYRGVNAGPDEPVLTLVAERDPWFQNPWTKGDCGRFLDSANGSRSVVYREGELAWRHELLDLRAPRQEVLDFLAAHLD